MQEIAALVRQAETSAETDEEFGKHYRKNIAFFDVVLFEENRPMSVLVWAL
jgi:hypothetical protein